MTVAFEVSVLPAWPSGDAMRLSKGERHLSNRRSLKVQFPAPNSRCQKE